MDAAAGMPIVAPMDDAEGRTASTFGDFYRQHYRAVVGIVYTLSGSRMASEELAQDAFEKAHAEWERLTGHPSPEAWVKRVAINLARSWGRRKAVEARALMRLMSEPSRVVEMAEPAERVWQAVRRLPHNQAVSIVLRYHDDRSIDDIAAIIGCSPATVRVHLHRGRTTLADVLGLDESEQDDAAPADPNQKQTENSNEGGR